MDFREATPTDASGIRQVARQAWHETYDEIIGEAAVDAKIEDWYDIEALEASIERADSPFFVAVHDGVIGFAQGAPSDDGPVDAFLPRIYVLPAYWGEGVGTTLLERVFDELRATGHDGIWLSVMADNDVGRAFYEKHGFESQKRQTSDLADQEVTEIILLREL